MSGTLPTAGRPFLDSFFCGLTRVLVLPDGAPYSLTWGVLLLGHSTLTLLSLKLRAAGLGDGFPPPNLCLLMLVEAASERVSSLMGQAFAIVTSMLVTLPSLVR